MATLDDPVERGETDTPGRPCRRLTAVLALGALSRPPGGHVRPSAQYEAGFVVFVVRSLACALSWNEVSLIVFRLAQGVGGALITANSGAVIADTFPEEQRGRAYGFNSIGFNTSAVLWVVLGGAIVTYVSWRWVFWIKVPIGTAAVLVARRVLVDRGECEHTTSPASKPASSQASHAPSGSPRCAR